MRRLLVLLLVPSLAFAEDVKLGGSVLVWADAKWFVDADTKAASIQLGKTRDLHHVVPAKFVGVKDAFVEVELQKSNDCAWTNATTKKLANVRLFVKRDDLAPVLAKPFRLTTSDGSSIALKPGVPVIKAGEKAFTISINGDRVDVDIPADSIAFSYNPPNLATPPKERGGTFYSVEEGTLAGHAIKLNQSTLKMTKRGKTALLTIAAPCIDAIVAAPVESVTKFSGGIGIGTGGGKGGRAIQERWYIAKGTTLLAGTRAVAKANDQIDVAKPADGAKEVCHDTEIGFANFNSAAGDIRRTDEAARILRLCVPIAEIKHENPMPARPSKN